MVIGTNIELINIIFFLEFLLFWSNFTIPILGVVIYFFPKIIINGAGGITIKIYHRYIISLSIGASPKDNNNAPYAMS